MTLSDVKTMLENIQGFSGKVAYYSFPIKNAPALPFICYFETSEDGFSADGINYHNSTRVAIELYTDKKDITIENKVETAFRSNELFYTKESEWLDDEKVNFTLYSITI